MIPICRCGRCATHVLKGTRERVSCRLCATADMENTNGICIACGKRAIYGPSNDPALLYCTSHKVPYVYNRKLRRCKCGERAIYGVGDSPHYCKNCVIYSPQMKQMIPVCESEGCHETPTYGIAGKLMRCASHFLPEMKKDALSPCEYPGCEKEVILPLATFCGSHFNFFRKKEIIRKWLVDNNIDFYSPFSLPSFPDYNCHFLLAGNIIVVIVEEKDDFLEMLCESAKEDGYVVLLIPQGFHTTDEQLCKFIYELIQRTRG